MAGVGDRDVNGLNRRMRHKVVAQHVGQGRGFPWRIDLAGNHNPVGLQAFSDKLQQRTRAVQGKPAPATAEKLLETLLLLRGRTHIAGIGDEEPGLPDGVMIAVIFGDPDNHVLVFG